MVTQSNTELNNAAVTLSQEAINEKIILIQSCLIQGHSFQAVMHNQSSFIQQNTDVDLLAICIEGQQQLSLEFLGSSKKVLLRLLKKYKIQPRSLMLRNFLKHYHSELVEHGHFLEIHSLEKMFEGLLSTKQYQQFEQEIGFKSAFVYPLFSFENEHIGYAVYFYLRDHYPNSDNLQLMTRMLQTLIQPLYDPQTQIFYSKCIRVTHELLRNLTPTEKRIVHQLLKAKPYTVIADEMFISLNTVKSHTKNIFAKYNVNSKMELFNKLKNIAN